MRYWPVRSTRFKKSWIVPLTVVAALTSLCDRPLHALSPTAPMLIVRVYDVFGTRAEELRRARDAVQAVLGATDVDLHWRQCHIGSSDPCDERPASNELVIRLLRGESTAAAVPDDALGYSSVQTARQQGTFATVYPDRVRRLAQRAGWDSGALLGNAIAHEVGHLLLGTTEHPDGGLMRPHWTAEHTRHSAPDDWTFRDEERPDVRAAVSRRAPDAGSVAWHAADPTHRSFSR